MKVELSGGEWAELKDVDQLTGADQDAYFDAYDEVMAAKPQPEPRPDPANPAVMLPAEPPKLTNADGRLLRDRLLGSLITAWSFDLPLPYTGASRASLPVRACNALTEAAGPMQDALTGTEKDEAPKSPEPSPGSGGSTGTSPESTGSPLPVPPAALSAMP